MGLSWAAFHPCLRPKIIIKMDDDAVVDFRQLIDFLQSKLPSIEADPTADYLAGYAFREAVPERSETSKWYVTREEYEDDFYPDYLSGWMYIIKPSTARRLILTTLERELNIFWIDDIWMTGILREKAGINITESFNHLYSPNPQFMQCCLLDLLYHQYRCPYMVGPNGGETVMINAIANAVKDNCYNSAQFPDHNKCVYRDSNIPSIKETCVGVENLFRPYFRGKPIVKRLRKIYNIRANKDRL